MYHKNSARNTTSSITILRTATFILRFIESKTEPILKQDKDHQKSKELSHDTIYKEDHDHQKPKELGQNVPKDFLLNNNFQIHADDFRSDRKNKKG